MAQRDDDDVYVYNFFDEYGVKLHCGLTNDPDRREREHRSRFREPHGTLRVEDGPMPRWQAREWEREKGCSPHASSPSRDEGAPGRFLGDVLAAGAVVGSLLLIGTAVIKACTPRQPRQ